MEKDKTILMGGSKEDVSYGLKVLRKKYGNVTMEELIDKLENESSNK